jgi:tryptophan 2-monooxygenase
VTDTFLQGAYGIAVSRKGRQSDKGYRGVLLASYTWEDDATKLLGDSDDELANRCLAELDEILFTRCRNIQEKISPYVVKTPKVWHWERTPSYRGCARLYRQGSWDSDYALLTYNREYSAASHLYLAGEAYSVEGGWVEPALRSALDAVIHLINHRCPTHTKGEFCNRFKFNMYPHHIEVTRPAPGVMP